MFCHALWSAIFWIAFLQWLFIASLVDLALLFVPSVGVLFGVVLNTIIVVMYLILFMPLYLTNNLPVVGLFRQYYFYGFLAGGLLSIPIWVYLRKRCKLR